MILMGLLLSSCFIDNMLGDLVGLGNLNGLELLFCLFYI